jgi:PASTA domain-containing protein
VSAFVEECRREWKRLGVPELLAEEMATDLEADLAEAREDGVAAEEILGESDPRRFAASWASERGLVPDPPPGRERRRRWPWVVGAIVGVWVLLAGGGALFTGVGGGEGSAGTIRTLVVPPIPATRAVPRLVGMKAARASAIARASGFEVRRVYVRPHGARAGTVVTQRPRSGVRARRGTTMTLRIARRRR